MLLFVGVALPQLLRLVREYPNLLIAMLDKAAVKTEKFGDATGEIHHLSDI
jgi:hypothetical protein